MPELLDKAKSPRMWWALGACVLLAGAVGLTRLDMTRAPPVPRSASTRPLWDGTGPLVCSGNTALTVSGVTAELSGTAVVATGNCALTLVNVDLTASTAIEAGGYAVVTMQGGKIHGSTLAVHAVGGAKVTLVRTKVTGKTEALGAATITGA
jgi:hypothetical protein